MYYYNVGFGSFFNYLQHVKFDLIIYDWSFVGARFERKRFKRILAKFNFLKFNNSVKVCLPQDEFTCMDILCEFINEFGITFIFSVAPSSEWKKIYRTVLSSEVKFVQILTGYLDESLIESWKDRSLNSNRHLDIGYRTVSTAIWGRFNLLKARIAEIFLDKSICHGFTTDIKVGAEYFKMGNEWLEFLCQCRFTLGVEGGSRILDWDGTILDRVTNYQKKNPKASFDDLISDCVPIEKEGEVNVVALSPRHLEACLTRTAQVLLEGDYNGILKPNVHYIPLKPDFSNISEVLVQMHDEPARLDMVENAHRDIVKSQNYTYGSMVKTILHESKVSCAKNTKFNFCNEFFYFLNCLYLWQNIFLVYIFSRFRSIRNRFKIAKS
ncbi:MAG: hypothetical protein O3A82_13590 [Verrucomicrobia bacterium]|nr:hypothetical protein [Verrucomicrobiota bacterium]